MTLSDYLAATGTPVAAFAQALGVHPVTVSKWKAGTNAPRPAQLAAILRLTGGQVTANDFHGLPGVAEAQAPFGAPAPDPLVAEARRLGLDPEAIAREALRRAVAAEKARRWQEENREAIAAHNRWVEEHGLPLAEYRMF